MMDNSSEQLLLGGIPSPGTKIQSSQRTLDKRCNNIWGTIIWYENFDTKCSFWNEIKVKVNLKQLITLQMANIFTNQTVT